MITLTQAAKNHIQKMLKSKGENAIFRLWIKETGCSGYMYMPEIVFEKKETDIEINTNDVVIYLDKAAVEWVQGTEIDFVQKSLGSSQLIFHNPNAEGLCGCGESFQIKKLE